MIIKVNYKISKKYLSFINVRYSKYISLLKKIHVTEKKYVMTVDKDF